METLAPIQSSARTAGRRIVLAMPGNQAAAARLALPLDAEIGHADIKRFPDGIPTFGCARRCAAPMSPSFAR